MSKKEFNVNELFNSENKQQVEVEKTQEKTIKEQKKKSATHPRLFKIQDDIWEDFLILTAILGTNQSRTINDLIIEKIKENADKINVFKEMKNK